MNAADGGVGTAEGGVVREIAAREEDARLQPAYALAPDALFGRQMVMTPSMLVDRLQSCQEDAERLGDAVRRRGLGAQQCFGFEVNPVADRLEQLSGDLQSVLALLARSGLWIDAALSEGTTTDGRPFRVLREPFAPPGPQSG